MVAHDHDAGGQGANRQALELGAIEAADGHQGGGFARRQVSQGNTGVLKRKVQVKAGGIAHHHHEGLADVHVAVEVGGAQLEPDGGLAPDAGCGACGRDDRRGGMGRVLGRRLLALAGDKGL